MTDTEAKALALVNEVFMERCLNPDTYTNRVKNSYHEAICRAIEREAATEARHAAELREQAERFDAFRQKVSDAVEGFWNYCRTTNTPFPADLYPFTLPAPDPVSEWLAECSDGRVSDHTMTMLRLFHNWLSAKETRKIGEAGE